MSEALLDKKFEYWQNQLLDLGKRNRMINYRETKRATLKLVEPDFEELFRRVAVDEEELTFQSPIDKNSDIRTYSLLSLLEFLSCPIPVNIGDIKTEGSILERQKTLKQLRSKSRLALDEQGTNILYMVSGFVEWREKKDASSAWIKSPLILVPVSLILESLNAPYVLKKYEDDVVVNPTLAYLFERDYGITLPLFEPEEQSINEFMDEMEKLVDRRGWRIVRENSIGLVSFLKINMYKDLCNNEEDVKSNPIIRAFAGEKSSLSDIPEELYNYNHDSIPAMETFQVVNADSSQQDAILLSQKGVSFVMQGPPGTGKSQTITNIIAQGLADGKRILFVSEKAAALEVVHKRLSEVHLDDFCLALHSYKANKKDVLEELGKSLELRPIKVKAEETAKLTELDTLKEFLAKYVSDIHEEKMPLEMSLYEVYGALVVLEDTIELPLEIEAVEKMTKDQVNRLGLLVVDFDKAKSNLGDMWYKNPWQGILCPYLEVSQKQELQNKIQDVVRILSALEECQLVDKTLADILTVDTLDIFKSLYEHARHCSAIPNSWFHRPIEREERLVRILRERKQTIDDLTRTLADRYDQQFFKLSGQSLYTQFVSDMRVYCGTLRNGKSEYSSFGFMEHDLQQILLLNETCQLLVDALDVLSREYSFQLPYEYDSIEVVLTICEMLLENRKLTDWYFGEESVEQRKQYAIELQNKLTAFVEQKQQLCKRYSDDILDCDNVDQLLYQLNTAENRLSALVMATGLEYSGLCTIAAFDLEILQNIEDTFNHDTFAVMANTYGLHTPVTLTDINTQISALEKVRHNKVVPSWKSLTTRNKVKQLLLDVISRTRKLTDDKKKLQEFFQQVGIVLDIATLSECDVTKLQHADETIPEVATIVSWCNSDEAYCLLDTIDQKRAQYASLTKKINDLRTKHRISDTIDNVELLAALQDCRDVIELSTPCSEWATSKTDAIALLEQVAAIANDLKNQRSQLLETYEESVFMLDYTGMLNRFKSEYTSFLKIFKSSYKEDLKQIRLVFREVRKKIKDDEIIALLQLLRQYNEDLKQYHSFSAQVARLLNIQEYDIWFEWGAVKKQLDAFGEVSRIFQDDAATYQFIVAGCRDSLYEALVCYDELNKWFVNNDEARKFYASLYTGIETDTAKIRDIFVHVRTMCTLFVSANHYVEYVLSSMKSQRVKTAMQLAIDIVDARNWFVTQSKVIEEYTGVMYIEDYDAWKDILSHLETFEGIVESVGESAGYSLVSKYPLDNVVIDSYLKDLMSITNILEYSKAVFHVASNTDAISTLNVYRLIEDIHAIVANATSLRSVYTTLSAYCPETYTTLSIGEIKNDLEVIILYQKTRDSLSKIDEEARAKIGEKYTGISTNWESVHSNIAFSSKVIQLLSGEVSSELVAAFVNATALYSEAQLSELWQYYATSKKIETEYSILNGHNNLNTKIQILSEVSAALNSAISIKNIVAGISYVECNYSNIVEDLHKLAQIQELQTMFNDDLEKVKKILPAFTFDSDTDWNYIIEIFNHLRQIKRAINAGNFDSEIIQFVTNGITGITVLSYHSQIEKVMCSKNLLTEITGAFENQMILETYSLSKLTKRLLNCNEQFATLDAWIDFRDSRKKCCEAGLEQFVLGAEDAYYKSGTLVNSFMKMFYLKWIEVNCAGTDAVAQFRARIQDSKIERFCELDAHQLPVAQMRIREKLISDMPNRNNFNRATDEMGILLHELNKKRKIMPLRKLFRTIPNLLLKLKPCMMMSPLSVSYFLEAETYKFDMVIFDEASQIFPQDAIGAICRGEQVVIAGDSKQLPPTSFFAASTNNLDDEYDSEEEEEEVIYDSILEEATNSLPNRSLLWHYRSRNEDLIAFSNQEIYKNKLTTFPSSNTVTADSGVEYVYVENGTYSGRCNIQEARKCVELIKEHITKHPERSLGIIAFSEKQQATIEETVHRFRESNPRYEKFFAEDREEPFFVKNLENVQGDERDTIFFSICYAKDPNGRMFMRFGPLGHQGGERRLNVAITRAKHNIKLVGSIMPYDIDLSKTKSEGIRMLKEYIEFAIKGSSVLSPYRNPNALYDTDEFCNGICKFLESKGYSVKQYVGNSEYKIDIAVEHPNYLGCYVAGIECDGNSYFMARTTRDREHLRKSILEQMGWKMYRVWSTEWINNKVGEQKRLLDFIADAIKTYKKGDDKAKISIPKQEDSVQVEVLQKTAEEPKKLSFPYYRMGDWRHAEYDYRKSNLQNLSARIRAVVEVEQPIHLDVLYRRLASAFGNEKATKPVRDTIDQALNRVMANEIVIEDGFVRFKTFTEIRARIPMGTQDRNIEYISKPEIADAMLTVIRNSFGIDRDALCAEVTSIFGYDRMGPKITKAMNDTIDYMLEKDMVIIMDGKMHIKEA